MQEAAEPLDRVQPNRRARSARGAVADPLPRPAPSGLLHSDVVALAAGWLVLTVGIWVRHGGVSELAHGVVPASTSITALSGLLASSIGLAGLVLIARPRLVERRYGLDRLFVWHRYLMETMAILLAVHVAAGYVEWSQGKRGFAGAFHDLTGRQPYMGLATIGALVIFAITIMSLRTLRRLLSYETWYFVHLTAYVGMAISFGHEIVWGSDLANDSAARWTWIAIHVAVIAALVWARFGSSLRAIARPLEITSTRSLSSDATVLRLGGRELAGWEADAGQFVRIRPLTSSLWWQTHPYSIAGAPTTRGIEITVKRRGDASNAIMRLPRGTKVAVEGPYGINTPDILDGRKVLLIAAGIGITPMRALLERMPDGAEPILMYRARSEAKLLFLDELRQICESKGGRVLALLGKTSVVAQHDPFSAASLSEAVPDIRGRAVVVYGPEAFVAAAIKGLCAVGVTPDNIHTEHAWW